MYDLNAIKTLLREEKNNPYKYPIDDEIMEQINFIANATGFDVEDIQDILELHFGIYLYEIFHSEE